MAYILDPSIVKGSKERLVDVDTTFGPSYGKSLAYAPSSSGARHLQPAQIVTALDWNAFKALYVAEMTKPFTPQLRPGKSPPARRRS